LLLVFRRLALASIALLSLAGCSTIPPGRAAVDAVDIRGARAIDDDDIADKIATAPSSKLLGLFRGVIFDYEIYDPSVVQRDLARVERLYRGHGFLDARARAGRVLHVSADHVRVEIVVDEGAPTINRSVRVDGLESLPAAVASAARLAATDALKIGERFDEEAYKSAQNAIKRALTDRGYAFASVTPDAALDVGARTADYVFVARVGAPATFGPITFAGLDPDGAGPRKQEIDEGPLRRAMSIEEGAPYSTAAIDAATQALLELEVFSAVEILPTLTESPSAAPVVPLTVRVEPTRLRQIRLGGGVEFDEIKTDAHLLAGWEDHNFLGGLRDLSIDFRPGAVLYPLRLNNLVVPDRLLPEERLRVQLRQPGFLEARTIGFLRPELNVYPLLVQTDPPANAPVVGYLETKTAAGVDRAWGKLFATLSYNVQVESPFAYKGELDPWLATLIIAFPQLITRLDFRDDAVHPHAGVYLANDLQIAGGPFGGDTRDVRVQPEVRTYIPIGKRLTFATRASVGFLFAFNYGSVVQNSLQETLDEGNRAERVHDIEKMYFRGFFSGGPSSNRGYPLRGIAPHGVVPFLNPATAAQQIAANCDPNNLKPDSNCSVPIGGFSLWELSNEVRFTVVGALSAATFCDMSDVSAQPAHLRLRYLHLSCGLGGRLDTPVGPLRVDIGYRIQPMQVIGYKSEDDPAITQTEGTPARLLKLPIAISFGIGESF
jgi:outer membrane translocation and assembly module TamA